MEPAGGSIVEQAVVYPSQGMAELSAEPIGLYKNIYFTSFLPRNSLATPKVWHDFGYNHSLSIYHTLWFLADMITAMNFICWQYFLNRVTSLNVLLQVGKSKFFVYFSNILSQGYDQKLIIYLIEDPQHLRKFLSHDLK